MGRAKRSYSAQFAPKSRPRHLHPGVVASAWGRDWKTRTGAGRTALNHYYRVACVGFRGQEEDAGVRPAAALATSQPSHGTIAHALRHLCVMSKHRGPELDEALSAVSRGDRRAFDRLVELQAGRLFGIARRVTGDDGLAEDVVQETFLRIIERRAPFRQRGSASGWLARVTTYLGIDLLRSRRARDRREHAHAMNEARRKPPAWSEDPQVKTLSDEELGRVLEEFERLPAETRAALWLNVVEGVGVRQIAESLGTSRSSASRRVHAGVNQLRRLLEAGGIPVAAFASMGSLLAQLPPPAAPATLTARLAKLGTAALAAPTAATLVTKPTSVGGLLLSGKKSAIVLSVSVLALAGGLIWWLDPFAVRGVPPDTAASPNTAAVDRGSEPERPVPATDSTLGEVVPIGEQPADREDTSQVPLWGKVTESSGAGVEGARVTAQNIGEWDRFADTSLERLKASSFSPNAVAAEVQRSQTRFARLPAARTDATGAYRFEVLPPGEYRLRATHPELLSVRPEHVAVLEGESTRRDLAIPRGETITGRVLDFRGERVAGAIVRATAVSERQRPGLASVLPRVVRLVEGDLTPLAECRSGTDGRFRLGGLAPYAYDLDTTHDHHAPTTLHDVAAGSGDAEIVLRAGVRLSGRIVDARSESLKSTVTLEREPTDDAVDADPVRGAALAQRTVETSADGTFTVTGLEPGSFVLRVVISGLPRLETPIQLDAGEVDLADVQVDSLVQVRGRVLDPDGHPLGGARVWVPPSPRSASRAAPTDANPLSVTETDGDGAFTLRLPPVGRWDVIAGHTDFSEAVQRQVDPSRGPFDLRLKSAHVVTGRVVDGLTQEPVVDAEVGVRSRAWQRVRTDSTGAFRVDPVCLSATDDPIAWEASAPEYYRRRGGLGFVSGPSSSVEVRLYPREYVHGRALRSDGAPAHGARIRIEVPGLPRAFLSLTHEWPRATRAGADGSFMLLLPETLWDEGPGFGGVMEVVAEHQDDGMARLPLENLPRGADRSPLELLLAPSPSLVGKVIDQRGLPLAGARLECRPHVTSETGRMQEELAAGFSGRVSFSRSDGNYSLPNLRPGVNTVVVQAVGEPTLRTEVVVAGPAQAQDFRLDSGATISGRVRTTDGQPLGGVEVLAFVDGEPSASATDLERVRRLRRETGQAVSSARSDDQGAFVLGDLPEDVTFYLRAAEKNFFPAEAFFVEPGLADDLVLRRDARLSGRVVDAVSGEPVRRFIVRAAKRREPFDGPRPGIHGWSDTELFLQPRNIDHVEGRFVLQGHGEGTYKITVEATGFAPTQRSVSLAEGEDKEAEFRLSSGTRVRGIVLDRATREPLAGARVLVHGRGLGTNIDDHSYRSLKDGTFEVEDLPSGKIYFVVFLDGYHYDQGNTVAIELPADAGNLVELEMDRAGTLRGRIRGLKLSDKKVYSYFLACIRNEDVPDGESPKEHWVWLKDSDGGVFRRNSMPPGDYRVELRTKDRKPLGELGEIEIRAGEEAVFEAEAPR